MIWLLRASIKYIEHVGFLEIARYSAVSLDSQKINLLRVPGASGYTSLSSNLGLLI